MNPVLIKPDIYWVGGIDWQRRDFHGYSISPEGTTYNAYLVLDEKITLFDTVSKEFAKDLIECIAKVVDPEAIDYIVANHGELDHSGALPALVERCKPEKVFCSPMGEKSLKDHFDTSGWPLTAIDPKTPLSLGKRTVHFVETRMLHWPDSMVSYIPHDNLLISSDGFGQNIASSERFADELDPERVMRQAARYFANIILPYQPMTLKAVETVEKSCPGLDMIAPDHGLIWRGREAVAGIVARYREFALQKPANKAVIVYDTMWKSTEQMAKAIATGAAEGGLSVEILSLKSNSNSDVMEAIFEAGAILIGSPTHNNTILPTVAGLLTYMKGLRPKNKIGAAFGSYGWSGESVKIISDAMTDMGFEVLEGVKSHFVPKPDALAACTELGRQVAQAVRAKTGK